MFRLSLSIFFLSFSTLCCANDEAVITKAKNAVLNQLTARQNIKECTKFKILAKGGEIDKSAVIAKCDNDFNVNYGLEYSSLKIHHLNDGLTVCGIVSGTTELSRIGARFVYEAGSGNVTLKPSKHPFYNHQASGEFGKNMAKLVNNQYRIVYKASCL
ncbi:hypothetical protein AU509_13350 [Lonsdalea britannica]|uniref:Spore coat protein U domain-containing protein n=1 Tax=Lonsdalea britannica TaxID=1082704 RepID=A0AAD0SEF4_9GAMM|nr:hypothetical protein [Lonsdalea britannica]AXW85751.1 hypothetical protein CKQ53_01310 [Lonsdalea britannica]OSM95518.1 hypothetical protein AU509_13350 [Lonsdalea britannica]